jgi:hypothetical protein
MPIIYLVDEKWMLNKNIKFSLTYTKIFNLAKYLIDGDNYRCFQLY